MRIFNPHKKGLPQNLTIFETNKLPDRNPPPGAKYFLQKRFPGKKPDKMKTATLQFLTNLKKNNNREWFNENKALYTAAHDDVLGFIDEIIEKVSAFDPDIAKLEAKTTLFRIYRDVRFSADKSPYKTHFGASLGLGKGHRASGYYVHIEPGKSFLAGGIYRPEPSGLKKIRTEISQNAKQFKKILESDRFRNNFRGLSVEDKLKRVPTGFDKDDPMAEFLKLKSFVVMHPVSDAEMLNPDAPEHFAEIFRAIQPLNDFLEHALV